MTETDIKYELEITELGQLTYMEMVRASTAAGITNYRWCWSRGHFEEAVRWWKSETEGYGRPAAIMLIKGRRPDHDDGKKLEVVMLMGQVAKPKTVRGKK